VTHARCTIGTTAYAVNIETGKHTLLADEPAGHGGRDAGPAPFDLLLSGLGACTAITLRMYADRKQWPVQTISVDLRYRKEGERGRVDRTIEVAGDLSPEQRTRMAEIAEKTPVTLTLKAGVEIVTALR
jgi:putative redox protein